MTGSAIADQFAKVCRDRPGALAVRTLWDGDSMTFADLAADCTALRQALVDLGVRRGGVVVSSVGNHPVFFALIVACMEMGAALVPLGDATDAETAMLVHEIGAAAILTDRAIAVPIVRQRALGPALRLLALPERGESRSYGESVVLKLTSGSTDLPRAAVADERHLINDGRHIVEAMGVRPDDVNFACIPLSHSYAIGNIAMPLLWQGTGVALRQVFNPSQFVHDIAATGATVFPGVPFMLERLKSLGTVERLPSSLRLLITAGARVDGRTVLWFKQTLGRKVHSFYGSSETGGITYDDSEEVAEPLHVGRAMPETTLTLRSEPGMSQGRIFVRGNAVARRYAQGEGDAASAFCDDGFLTSDLGHLDDEGRLVLAGRVSALVNVAGRKVDPAEVERRLVELPGIADARVLGVSCDRRGQEVVAFIVRDDAGMTPLAIRRLCAATLSTHKIPRRFVFLDRLPVDARGKLDRRVLQELASAPDDG